MDTTTHINDIAWRIAEAITASGPATRSVPVGNPAMLTGEPIGMVPEHLRHLHNLLARVVAQAEEAEKIYEQAEITHAETVAFCTTLIETEFKEVSATEAVELITDAQKTLSRTSLLSEHAGKDVQAVMSTLMAALVAHIPKVEYIEIMLTPDWFIYGRIHDYKPLNQRDSMLIMLKPVQK